MLFFSVFIIAVLETLCFYFYSLLNFWNLFRLCLHYINKIIIKNTHFQKQKWRQLSSQLRFIIENIMSSSMWSQCFISIRSIILTGGLFSLNMVHFCYFSKINFSPSPFFPSKQNSASFRYSLFSHASYEF